MDESTTTSGDSADEENSRFSKAKDFVGDTYADASDAMKNQFNRFKERVDDVDMGEVTDQFRAYIRSNPGKAMLISIGVGFIVGLLLRREDEEEG